MAEKALRSARRQAAAGPSAPAVTQCQVKLDGLIQDFARANAAKNKATSDEKRARGLVHAELIAQGKEAHQALCEIDGNRIAFAAVIAAGTKDVIDVEELRKICSEEQFLKIISATKQAVETALGKNAVLVCTRQVTTPPDLKIARA